MTRWKTESEDTKVANIDLLAGKVLRKKVCASFSGGHVVSRMGNNGCEDVSSSISDCTSTSGSSTTPLGKTNGTFHNGKENEYDFDFSEEGNEAESYVPAMRRANRPSTTTFTGHRATSSSVSTSSDGECPSNSGIPNRPPYAPADFLKDKDTLPKCVNGGIASTAADNERPSSSGIPNGFNVPPNTARKIRTVPSASTTGSVYGGDATYMNNFKAPVASATAFPFQGVNSLASASSRVVQDPERPQGDVGLHNIGNTCFLSSGLQCLIHSPTLAEFFLRLDLGDMSQPPTFLSEFQLLIQHAWWGISKSIYPTTFRIKLAERSFQFNNSSQQDCQEFLALGLDTLHEQLKSLATKPNKMVNGSHSLSGDSNRNGYIAAGTEHAGKGQHKRNGEAELNKPTKKLKLDSSSQPQTPPSSVGGGDAGDQNVEESMIVEVASKKAEDYWNKYMDKNNTVFSNTFQGLFKSTVVCSECSNVSVTYEPFMYLSVPIPHAPFQNISVTFMSLKDKDRRPLKVTASLLADERVGRLKELVTREIPGLPADSASLQNYVLVEVVNNNVARKLKEEVQIKCVHLASRNIYMYELNENFCEKYGRYTNTGTLSGTFTNNNHSIPPTNTYTAVPPVYEEDNWKTSPSPLPTQELPSLVLNGTPDTTTSPGPSPDLTDPLASTSTSGEVRVDTTVTDGGDGMEIGATTEEPTTESVDSEKFECVICFEDFSYSDALNNTLLKHKKCGTIMCHECLLRAVAFNNKEKEKNEKLLKCPGCGFEVPDSVFVNFESHEYSSDLNLVAVLLRLPLDSNNNTSKNSGRLFGAPLVVRIPASVAAEELYNFIGEINPFPELDSTLVKVNCDGDRCSFCCDPGCDGCVVEREGLVSITPGTALAISFIEISREQIASVEPVDMASCPPTEMRFTSNPSPEPDVDIHDALRVFSAVEHLDEKNPWHCGRCDKPQRATKTMTICRFPDCLIIILKRFVFTEKNESHKLSTRVRFPLCDLDMYPYTAPEGAHGSSIYDLYSCVCHHGATLQAGHYTSYAKNPMTNAWSYYNDQVVSVNRAPQDAEYETAYCLFFQRKGLRCDIPPRTEETIIRNVPISMTIRPTPTATPIPLPMPNPATVGSIRSTSPVALEQGCWEGPKRVLPEPSYATTLDGPTGGNEEMNFSGGHARLTSFPCVSSSNTGNGLSTIGEEMGGGFMTDDQDPDYVEDNFLDPPTAPVATLYTGSDEDQAPSSQSDYTDEFVTTSTENTQWRVMD